VWLLGLVVSSSSFADFLDGGSIEILPVNEAFRFGHIETDFGIDLFWQVQPGYFLYRDKISVTVDGVEVEVPLQKGKWYVDATFGRVQVLEGFITSSIASPTEEVSVNYQGCAEKGYCYPPQKNRIKSLKKAIKSIK